MEITVTVHELAMSSPRRRGSSLKLCMDSRFHGNDTNAALLNPERLQITRLAA